MDTYRCQRGRALGYHSCSCRECVKRQRVDARLLAERQYEERKKAQLCPHGVPLKYACVVCDPF